MIRALLAFFCACVAAWLIYLLASWSLRPRMEIAASAGVALSLFAMTVCVEGRRAAD